MLIGRKGNIYRIKYKEAVPGGVNKVDFYISRNGQREAVLYTGRISKMRFKGDLVRPSGRIGGHVVYLERKSLCVDKTKKCVPVNRLLYTPMQRLNRFLIGVSRDYLILGEIEEGKVKMEKIEFDGKNILDVYAYYLKDADIIRLIVLRPGKIESYNVLDVPAKYLEIKFEIDVPNTYLSLIKSINDKIYGVSVLDSYLIFNTDKKEGFLVRGEIVENVFEIPDIEIRSK